LENTLCSVCQGITDLLSLRKKIRLESPSRQPSGVLIPLYEKNDRHFLVLTLRSEKVHHHKGEMSFPGGGYHQSDGSLRQTALRESYEEIGLDPGQVEILGELDDVFTKGSPFVITPFIGVIPPDYPFKLSKFEIGELILVEVEELLKDGCCLSEPEIVLDGCRVTPCNYIFGGRQVTGATARILRQFLDVYSRAVARVGEKADRTSTDERKTLKSQ
jgi:8-oxo-dGTP pyrophosphatase MutT (NUDIX family)